MTESELVELELATSLRLPVSYRKILAQYPSFPVCEADPDFRPQDDGLYASKEALWDVNVDDVDYVRTIFPPTYFVIGDSGCGDFYAIDTTNQDSPVYISGPHHYQNPDDLIATCEPVSESIELYIERLTNDIKTWQGCKPEHGGLLRRCIDTCCAILLVVFALISMMTFVFITIPLYFLQRVFRYTRS